MRHLLLRVGLLGLSLWLAGCGASETEQTGERVARTGGGAVALSRDERIAVVANRSAGVVTVFSLEPQRGAKDMVTASVELDTGEGSEPWAAVIGRDDDTAYVVLRQSQSVVRITSLHGTPSLELERRVAVGSEPSAIAISPSGQMLFVANHGEGTISMIDAPDFEHRAKLNLNQALVETGVLGDLQARPALAHPRALAITDKGDGSDEDEILYATEFFSQALLGVAEQPDLSHLDRNRQGFVYRVKVDTGTVLDAIPIAPVEATGFADGEGRMTSCFPNQLQAAALMRGRLHVTGMCTSPRGPLGPKNAAGEATSENFKTLFHPAVFVVDTETGLERPEEGRLLTRVLSDYYDGGEDEAGARMPLIPNDLAFQADSPEDPGSGYLTALGADAVFRLDYDSMGQLQGIGSPGARYIDVGPVHGLPVGIAVSRISKPPFALAVNDAMQRLSVIDVASEQVTVVKTAPNTPHAVATLDSSANEGRKVFVTGLDAWSHKGQAWSSCEGCHPGGQSDGVTWSFARGPRRTLSTAGTYDKAPELSARTRRLLLWGANVDEVHDVEAIARGVSGGVGGVVWKYADPITADCRLLYDGSTPAGAGTSPCQAPKPTSFLQNGLNGALATIVSGRSCASEDAVCDSSGSSDWNHIDDFIRSLRAPQRPTELSQDDLAAGRVMFARACAACHAGPSWTLSTLFYTPGEAANGLLPYTKPAARPALGALRETRYEVDVSLRSLNPPAAATGSALYRRFAPVDATDAAAIAFAYDPAVWGGDQLACALRAVGTFPPQPAAAEPILPTVFTGIVPEGAPPLLEYRQDGKTLGQGASGFSIPSLFGLSLGAPYFHAGNARTLEELFDDVFAGHHRAIDPSFLTDPLLIQNHRRALIAFLLSIDESAAPEALPGVNASGDSVDFDFCRP